MGRISKLGLAFGTSGSPIETLMQQEYDLALAAIEKQILQMESNQGYNREDSKDVGIVNEINKVSNHKVDIKGTPNSVTQNYSEKGELISERYYNEKGEPYLDIDYTNHGNSKMHPIVPHQHKITIVEKGIKREKKGTRIRK